MDTFSVRLLKILRLVMPAFYLLAGVLLLFTGFLAEQTGKYQHIAGGLMLLYGIFRFYRTFKNEPKKDSNETAD